MKNRYDVLRHAFLAALGLAAAVLTTPVRAQPYARFMVPDSSLDATVAASGAEFESTWNALLIAGLRTELAGAELAPRLVDLARHVASAETRTLGSRIGADAMALRRTWATPKKLLRIEAARHESLGVVARGARDFGVAESHFLAATEAYRALGERRREAWTLGSIGAALLMAGDHERALPAYDKALAARRALGDPRLVGNALSDMGQTMYQLHRFEDSHRLLAEAAELRERLGQWAMLANTLGHLGNALAALGRIDSSQVCFRRSLGLLSAEGDSARLLPQLLNYGTFVLEHGDPEEGIAVHERAIALAKLLEDPRREAMLESNFGELLRKQGDFSDALLHFERALGFQSEDDRVRVNAFKGYGKALSFLGDAERAREFLQRALALADSIEDPSIQCEVRTDLAGVLQDQGDVSGAARIGREALDIAVASGDSGAVFSAASDLGGFAIDRGDYAFAHELTTRALGAFPGVDAERACSARANRALALHLLGRLDEAEREYAEALSLASASHSASSMLEIVMNLGDVAERRGDFAEAFARYGRALGMIDSLRSRQYRERDAVKAFASRRFVYEAVIHLLCKRDRLHPDSGFATRAFDLAEKSRARGLLDRVAVARHTPTAAQPIGLAEAQRRLGPTEALLEFSVGDSSTTLWVLRRDRWQWFSLPPRGALRARVLALRQGLSGPERAQEPSTWAAAHTLHRLLVEPAEALLRGVDHVVLSPDGPLAVLPFEALLAREPALGKAPAVRDYFGGRFAVTYTPSATALSTRAPAPGERSIVALGDPVFASAQSASNSQIRGTPLAPLPNTADEVVTLSRLARGPFHSLTGSGATREGLLSLPGLAEAGIIHIATHADANEADPDHSGFWLAPAHEGEGPSRLEVRDVSRLRLSADLVTLSACRSGLGRIERGEGVVGLARAFLAAGARSVVVSLWDVNDRSTARLMEAFYTRLLSGRMSRAQALAEARRDLMRHRETRSPWYWAPFVLVGESGPLR